MTAERTGVVVMAYGTPTKRAGLEAYYTHIRRGRAPTADQLADLAARYDSIGGISPLAERTAAQVSAIGASLDTIAPHQFTVALGQKHASPFIEEAVAHLASRGAHRIVGVVLAPHYSRFSVGEYHRRATDAATEAGLRFDGVDRWFDLDPFVAHQAASLRAVLASMPAGTKTVFTAHSLPERVLVGDPYPDELAESARAIAAVAGLGPWSDWGLAWQSAGRTPEPWRGPDVLTVISDLADSGRAPGIVVVPHGFTSDHLEVVYDLDIEARRAAVTRGLSFERTDVVNADPAVMRSLAERVAALTDVARR